MAEVVEKELEENVTNLPPYTKDTTDFFRKIETIKHTKQPYPIRNGCKITLPKCSSIPAISKIV